MARVGLPIGPEKAPAIVVLGPGALKTARHIQACCLGARLHGLVKRLPPGSGIDRHFSELGTELRALYAHGTPIVALCAAGIVIRCLAPTLAASAAGKTIEPLVLAVAEDGSAVVPLLGGLSGVNAMARDIAAALDTFPAITTSGESRFGTCLLNPPPGYTLADLEHGKHFVSDLLAGASVRIEGVAPWLEEVALPRAHDAERTIRVTPWLADACAATSGVDPRWGWQAELLIHPRCVLAWISDARSGADDMAARVRLALAEARLAGSALALLLAPASQMRRAELARTAALLDVPVRFVDGEAEPVEALRESGNLTWLAQRHGVVVACATHPLVVAAIGRARGKLSVVGLGPGSVELTAPAARAALEQADDILGYETYLRMAGPFRPEQRVHASDNRAELQRARHAFELAATGRQVVVVSSGDPGVFAMAAAVMEALDDAGNASHPWFDVELDIVPGISAAFATAARVGAPLGHDFCVLSLSDNLKPWSVIETRLRLAAHADLAMALYNPRSRARPRQFECALDVLRGCRAPSTKVVLGHDIGRPDERVEVTSLAELRAEQVDMRTLVIIGSSLTRGMRGNTESNWVYTPRWYR